MTIKNVYTPHILCADIGGSHITAAVCDCKTNVISEQSSLRANVNSKGDAINILNAWNDALERVLDQSPVHVSGMALAMPGPFDYERGISLIKGLDKYESLYGTDIRKYFSNALQIPESRIKFRNDAEATVAGECITGAGKGEDNVIGITLGTGFGSAHFAEGEFRDLNLGSLPFKETIADDYLSTRGIIRRYYELSGKSANNVKELAAIADRDDAVVQVFEDFAENLGNFLRPHLLKLAPDRLILCGNIAKAAGLFLTSLTDRLPHIKIELAQLGEHAALIGAANLFNTVDKTLITFKKVKKS
ncbi:ROK family protein [Mucilaginibacter sp. SJ]|uniref:ROK family protein n=1 Tax=Mucilaginibacter sp. SJ TaxID=3029053 RepID=UPI0023A96427|nr:ROK family protein [Mucilaginibacter sp. SJ]WEA00609.1 ROK family protein [Mucilaginibacter sp. SJ]